MEAMKMQNVLRAAQPGKIKSINVKEGASVQANDIMIEIDDIRQ